MIVPNPIVNINELKQNEITSRTYRLDFNNHRISGFVDGFEAAVQAAIKVFLTERYAYPIYSSQYGIEIQKYIAKDYDYILSDLPRSIRDSLSVDDRIKDVRNFSFEKSSANAVTIFMEIVTSDSVRKISAEVQI